MKKKTVLALLVALCMSSAVAGMTACGGTPGEEKPPVENPPVTDQAKPSVTLNKTSVTLDDYGRETLTATVKDALGEPMNEAVVWTADGDVVTVTDGVVQARGKAGTAVITATCGEVSATCSVTVETSGKLPQVSVNGEVSVIVGKTFQLTPSVTYGKEQQTDVKITYIVADPAVATVAEDGTISALKFGSTTITVKAAWRGFELPTLTKTVNLTVKEDVLVAITSEAQTIFTAEVEVDGKEFKNKTKLASRIEIEGKTDGVIAANIEWKSSDPTIATVDGEGNVTANPDKKEGTAQITLTYNSGNATYVSEPVTVTVSYPVIDKTEDITLEIEAYGEQTLKTQITAADVFGEGTEKSIAKVTETGDKTDILESAAWVASFDAGNAGQRTVQTLVYNEDYAYKVNVFVVTKFISSYEDLTKMQVYGNGKDVTTPNVTYHNYSGYFVLTDDIIVRETDAAFCAKSIGALSSSGHIVDANGFSGTFDGRGHSIVNFKTGAGGLFGDIGKNAVIKNVSIVNATLTEEAAANSGAGLLGFTLAGGSVENVFISFTTTKARSGVFGRAIKGGYVKNLIVHYNYSAGYNGGALTAWCVTPSTMENVSVVYKDGMATAQKQLVGEDGNKNKKAFDDKVTVIQEAELANATFDLNALGDLWTIPEAGGLPVFESAVGEYTISQTVLEKEAGEADVTLTAFLADIAGNPLVGVPAAVWTTSDSAVATVSNGVVSFVGEGEATITTKIGNTALTCTVTVTVPAVEIEDKTSAGTLELEAVNEDGLKEQLAAAIGRLEENFLEGVTVTKIALESDRGTELNNDEWIASADTGSVEERTHFLVVYGEKEGAEVAYQVSAVIVTKYITSYEDLTKMQEYAGVTEVTTSFLHTNGTTYHSTYHNYEGYFVLVNDIAVTDSDEVINAKSIGSMATSGTLNRAYGFSGTFDGRGHTIAGLKAKTGGIFGDLSEKAIIKNVAIVDATITEANGGVLAFTAFNATLENVFVSFTSSLDWNGLIGHYSNAGKWTNLIVYHNFLGGNNAGTLAGWQENKSLPDMTNVVVVHGTASTKKLLDKDSKVELTTVYGEADLADASFDMDALGDLWTKLEGGMPIFKTALAGYTVTLDKESIATEVGADSQTLTVTVKGFGGAVIGGMPIVWTTSDSSVATIENGKIAFVGEGEATITVKVGEEVATCEITLTIPAVEIEDKTSEGTFELEALGETALKDQLAAAISLGGGTNFLEEVEISKITTNADRETALDNDWFASVDTGSVAQRTHTLVVFGTKANREVAYQVSVVIVTKFISTYEDLTELQEYGKGTDVATANNTYHNYSGYFVLTNNVTIEDSAAAIAAKCIGALSSGGHIVKTNGFSGTFDGRGFAIINAKFGAGGLFGDIGQAAVIKNLAIVNATITEEVSANAGAGVLCFSLSGGTIENVYVSYTTTKARSGVFGRAISGGVIKNLVVYYTYSAGYSGGSLTAWVVSNPTYSNVNVIYSNAMSKVDQYLFDGNKVNTAPTANVAEFVEQADGSLKSITAKASDKTGITLSEEAVDGVTAFAGFATGELAEYWDLSGSYPVFKSSIAGEATDPGIPEETEPEQTPDA